MSAPGSGSTRSSVETEPPHCLRVCTEDAEIDGKRGVSELARPERPRAQGRMRRNDAAGDDVMACAVACRGGADVDELVRSGPARLQRTATLFAACAARCQSVRRVPGIVERGGIVPCRRGSFEHQHDDVVGDVCHERALATSTRHSPSHDAEGGKYWFGTIINCYRRRRWWSAPPGSARPRRLGVLLAGRLADGNES